MRKLIYSIAFLIFLSFPLSVKASYLPPVMPDTSQITPFLENVAQTEIVKDSSIYLPPSDLNQVNLIVNGRSINDSLRFTYLDNANILTPLEFYTSDGVSVPQSDTYTVYGTSDVGPVMFVADKTTGETLYTSYGGNLVSTITGGEGLTRSFPEFIVRDLVPSGINNFNNIKNEIDVAKQESLIVYGNTLTESDKEFLNEYRFYCRYSSVQFGWTCFVPNACTTNTLVCEENFDTTSCHVTFGQYDWAVVNRNNIIVYTNDPSEVYYSNANQWAGLNAGTFPRWGFTFAYKSKYAGIMSPFGDGGTIDYELPTQAQYRQYRSIGDDSVYLQPVEEISDPEPSDVYNYTIINNNRPVKHTTINNSYNYEGDTNINNYPVYNTYEFPSYPTNYEYITNIYNYYTTPQEGESIGQVDPENVTDNIPILNNLKYRFPFSIPFDIYNLVSGLAVERQAPHFEWSLYFPVIDYTWVIDFDLSAWDTQAGIFRTCFLILFIIALAMWAYNHFFGS